MAKPGTEHKLGLLAAPIDRASCCCLVLVVAVLACVASYLGLPPSPWWGLPYLDAKNITGACQGIQGHIQRAGFWADTQAKDELVKGGALSAVLRALSRHSDNRELQRVCIDTVASLVAGVSRHQLRASLLGGVRVLLGSMRRFAQDPAVLGVGSTTLGCMCDFFHPNSWLFGALGARELFIQALKDHSKNPTLLFQLYCGLTGMTCHGIITNNNELVRLGLIEIGVQHMRSFPEDHSIREEVQPVLSCLTRAPPNNEHKQRVLDAGFLPEVLSAMRDFPGDVRLVSKGLESIRDFATNRPDVGADLRNAGVFDVIVESMSKHPPLKEGAVFWNVHTSGAQALGTLASQSLQNREAMFKAGAHKQLLRAMDGDKDAQWAACMGLRHIASLGLEERKQLAKDGVAPHCLSWSWS